MFKTGKGNYRVSDSTRARFYVNLSNNFEYKPYLDFFNIKKFRIALTKFRVSSHRLSVEVGRWHRPNPIQHENRLCNCLGVVEDEYHFLLECTLYSNIRHVYICRRYYHHPNRPKFLELMSSTNETHIKKYCHFHL